MAAVDYSMGWEFCQVKFSVWSQDVGFTWITVSFSSRCFFIRSWLFKLLDPQEKHTPIVLDNFPG